MLFPAWTGDLFRPTRDLDLLGFGDSAPEALIVTFKEIFAQTVDDDGLKFDIDGVTAYPIRKDKVYGGVRVKTRANLLTARFPVQIDIGFGDKITPVPDNLTYPSLLDFPAPRLRAYPKATVVAEKFEAMVQLGLASTRIKDFYDLAVLSHLFGFSGDVLTNAIVNTFQQRKTKIPIDTPPALTEEFAAKPESGRLWRQFVEDDSILESGLPLREVLVKIAKFVLPPAHAAANAENFDFQWQNGGPWK